jgi:hypothetical protein
LSDQKPEVTYHVVPVVLTTSPGSRLEQLLASYENVKAAAEEAKSRQDALTDALKAEMTGAVPEGTQEIILSGPPGLPALRMTWKQPYRFDVKRFRDEHPALYVRYETRGGHWDLRQAK